MPTTLPCPLVGAATQAPQPPGPASPPSGQLACNVDGQLSSAVALVGSKIAKAIMAASERRRRAAVLLLHFAPRCSCDGNAPCWDLGLADLLARVPQQTGEWGPLRLDQTTLVMVAHGFRHSSHIQRRATDILTSVESGWCLAGHERMLECAIGIGLFPEDGNTAERLLARADEALCDLRAVGQNAAGFSLRRTVPAASKRSDRVRAQGSWQRALRRDDCASAGGAPPAHTACV